MVPASHDGSPSRALIPALGLGHTLEVMHAEKEAQRGRPLSGWWTLVIGLVVGVGVGTWFGIDLAAQTDSAWCGVGIGLLTGALGAFLMVFLFVIAQLLRRSGRGSPKESDGPHHGGAVDGG